MSNKKSMYVCMLLLPFIELLTALLNNVFDSIIPFGSIIKSVFLFVLIFYTVFVSKSKNKKKSIIFQIVIIVYICISLLIGFKSIDAYCLINLFRVMYYPLILSNLICYFDDKHLSKSAILKIFRYNLFFLTILVLGFNLFNYNYLLNNYMLLMIILFMISLFDKKLNIYNFVFFLIPFLTIMFFGSKLIQFIMIIILIVRLFSYLLNKESKKVVLLSLFLVILSIVIFSLKYLRCETVFDNLILSSESGINVVRNAYDENFDLKTILLGLDYLDGSYNYLHFDLAYVLFYYGIIGLIIVLIPFVYYFSMLIKNGKLNILITSSIVLAFVISCIYGGVFISPFISIYLAYIFTVGYSDLGLLKKKENDLIKDKVTIYTNYINTGRVIEKANALSKKYDVEIISLFKLDDKYSKKLYKKVKVNYLSEDENINRFYLKNILLTSSMINCNSEIIITTSSKLSIKLINTNEYKNIKIADEYEGDFDKKYFKLLKKILKKFDYLVTNDIDITQEYKDIFVRYRYKIITDYIDSNSNTVTKDGVISFHKNDIYSSLYIKSKNECYDEISEYLKHNEKKFIITANPESYMLSLKDKDINDMLYTDNLVVPDGISVVKTAKYLGYDIKERITGVDLVEYLFKSANENKYSIYLFGASSEVIDKLQIKIKDMYPNIKIAGATDGYVKDKDLIMKKIKKVKPDIILLALGIPKQEKLIYSHIKDFDKGIFVGVGGSFDVLSGVKKRAPKILIDLNLEWLYRISKEPKRISRFIKHNIKFLIEIVKEKINMNSD